MKRKVLVIVGPTGVGKTSLSIQIAKTFHGEIISGDAYQIYQGLSIGTAKITEQEMEGIPHALVDCVPYDHDYSVMEFQKRAREIIHHCADDILPIVCGGTGLYIKSLLYDYVFTEETKDQDYMKFLSSLSNSKLIACLNHVDPNAWKTIHPNNRKRIIRALEIAHSGKRKSEKIEEQSHTMVYDAFIIGLTMDRNQLYARIDARVDQMMKQGLAEEVKRLVKQDKNIWNRQSFQSIGYKEWQPYFSGECDIDTCITQIKKNSRNFAKRQYTWFRNQMHVNWYDIEQMDWKEQLFSAINEWINR